MKRVLVIDDEESIRLTISTVLRKDGYQVETAACFEEAFGLLRSSPPDTIILDVLLPGLSGLDILKYLKEQGIETPVIVITGAPDIQSARESLRHGAYDYIAKPFSLDVLRQSVQRAIRQKELMDAGRELEEQRGRYREELERQVRERTTEIEHRNLELAALNRIGKILGSSLALQDTLQAALAETVKAVDAALGAVYIASEGYLALTASVAAEPQAVALLPPTLNSEILAPLLPESERLTPDQLPPELRDVLAQSGASRVALYSLMSKEQTLGTLVVGCNCKEGADSPYLTLLRAVAQEMAGAVQNARLYEETRRQAQRMRSLYEMGMSLSSALGVDTTLETLYRQTKQLVKFSSFFVALYDEENDLLNFAFPVNNEQKLKPFMRPMDESSGLSAHVIRTRKPLLVDDVLNPSEPLPVTPQSVGEPSRSWLGVPLLAKDRVVGILSVHSNTPGMFSISDQQLLELFASHAAIALENARLFEEAVRRRQQTEAIIQNMAEGVLVLDKQGRIAACNPALRKILGLGDDPVIGRIVRSLDEATSPGLAALWDIAAPVPGEEEGPEPDSDLRPAQADAPSVWVREVTFPEPVNRIVMVITSQLQDWDGHARGYVKVVRDITEQREVERMKSDFISTVSHELRTPLFYIKGFAELMLQGKAEEPKVREEFLTIIRDQTEHLNRLVEDLLDTSRFDRGSFTLKKEKVPVEDLLRQSATDAAGLASQAQIALKVEVGDHLPDITGDFLRLKQVMVNLIGNAIKFSKPGTTVIIRALLKPDELWVQIEDHGPGIAAKHIPRVFDKFYQVEPTSTRSRGGAGLGLYISKQIIERLGGRIWVESQVGKGSVFTFALPLDRPARDSQPA